MQNIHIPFFICDFNLHAEAQLYYAMIQLIIVLSFTEQLLLLFLWHDKDVSTY
jgi:hypothetical protein